MIKIKEKDIKCGYVSAINGSLIKIKGLESHVHLFDLINIPKYNILGEVIQIYSNHIIAQCFEITTNLQLNEEVISLDEPLSMELGPGLLASVFDGIQRPLGKVFKNYKSGKLERGLKFPSLSRTKKWHFTPLRKINDEVQTGDIIGSVKETIFLEHKIMVPPFFEGKLSFIAHEGDYTITHEIFRIKKNNTEHSFSMLQKWPITKNRPYMRKEDPKDPLITGIRIIDLLFPIAKGGTTAIPGGFGTGKTVIQQLLAKWCNADVVVFIGCGEPGNEIANVLKQFTEINDPQSGKPLLERVILIANTSNMPVSAREASLFSGVTIAEYYRDMGYDVAVLADSTSRWAESLREISGLLEEMPAEEGYPAYLPSKLSSFYERAGVVRTLGRDQLGKERTGSISIIGTISPPAGDFSEPVTSTTKRLVQVLWALDPKLAYLKHYPAISWVNSYSNYSQFISEWWYERDIDWPEIDVDWSKCRKQVNEILSQEQELQHVLQLVGEKNLPEEHQLVLFIAKIIRNGFTIQNAFDEIDAYTNIKKLLGIIKIMLIIYNEGKNLIERGVLIEDLLEPDLIDSILRISQSVPNEDFQRIERIKDKLIQKLRISAF
ncbi:MAG: V-type ATP synthase subunit A [Promethearchaeota archaeon]|nr:MAG: V-type ATP synthase subunit A [Candidatus Lokiarchaeota archaeon]